MSKLVNPFFVRILIFKFIISIPSNGAKNLLRPNDIYKFMTLLPQDYYLILGNNAKNLLRPFFICMKNGIVLSCKMTHLKFVRVVSITASA